MPSQSKVGWAKLKVGVMAIAALVILAVLVFLMSGRGFFRAVTDVYVYLDDSAAIAEGAPVRLNGILVGKVTKVGLSGSSEPHRIVRVTLEIDNEFLGSIPSDSQAGLAAENLLGTKYMNIKKGMSPQTVKGGSELSSSESPELEDLFQQGSTALAALQSILKRADGIIASVEVGQGTIGKLLVDETLYNKVLSIADEAQKLTVALNEGRGTMGKLLQDDALYNDVRGSVTRINTMLDGIEQGQGTVGQLVKNPALYDDTRKTIADVRQLLAGVEAGQGTVGKLLKSDELHDQIKGTIGRLDMLMDKINNGGGTVSQLLNNPQLYESLDGTAREMQGLLKDFRSNPKKFLRIKIGIF